MAALLLEHQNLEALKVSEVSTALAASDVLGPGSGLPLLVGLVGSPGLLDLSSAGTTVDLGDNNVGKSDVVEVGTVARNLGAIYKDVLVVNDLDNGGKFAGVDTALEEDNATKLNLAPFGGLDFAHDGY